MNITNKLYSKDGTIKYVLSVQVDRDLVGPRKGREKIEAAFIDVPEREDGKPRYVLCLSSMVGCIYQCMHCRNSFNSFYRVLSSEEIQNQIGLVLAEDGNRDKIEAEGSVEHAFMGIGEPLFSGNAVEAVKKHKPFVKDTRFAFSTVAAKGYIDRLTNENFDFPVRLEISLHFPTDNLRRQLIHPQTLSDYRPELNISRALDDAERFMAKHGGRVTLNYALIDRINNSEQDALEIAELLKNRKGFYVKVMEPNQTSALTGSWADVWGAFGLDFGRRGDYHKTPEKFRDALKKLGVEATAFRSKGVDISAGCGMMAS